MAKVVLIYPGIGNGLGFNNDSGERSQTWPHPGLALISALLKQHGHRVELIDLRKLSGWEMFEAQCAERNGNGEKVVFGITVLTVNFGIARECASRLRKVVPNAWLVAGGPHPTLMTQQMQETGLFDTLVQAEGEVVMLEIADAIERGERPPAGIVKGKPVANLDDLPFFDRDLFDVVEEPVLNILPRPFLTLVSGRGCLYHCTFCQPAERLMFGGVRNRSVESVIAEIKLLQRSHGLKSTMFQDDCLTQDREWVLKFCDALETEGISLEWCCQARADIICANEDMVARMRQCGLRALSIGFESGSDRILKFLGKQTTAELNLRAAEICHRHGISMIGNFMMGIPTETEAEVWQTVDLIKKVRPYVYLISFFAPTPGSGLYTYCERNGLMHDDTDFDNYSRSPSGEKIKGVDYALLRRAYREALRVGEKLSIEEMRRRLKEEMELRPRRILVMRSVRSDQFNELLDDLAQCFDGLVIDAIVQRGVLDEVNHDRINGEIHPVDQQFLNADRIPEELYTHLRTIDYDAVVIPCLATYQHGYEQPHRIAERILDGTEGRRVFINENREPHPEFHHAIEGAA